MTTSGQPDRPPAFMRRHLAGIVVDDPDTLVALACDENFWVRRVAVRNPATPRWVIDLLVRAGADADLRGRAEPDAAMGESELRRLVECGPWAQELVARHPNSDHEILSLLAAQPARKLRVTVAGHARADPATLSTLCADGDQSVRAAAAANPNTPTDTLALMARAGATPDLGGVAPVPTAPSRTTIEDLATLGPWGRFLAARHACCPPAVLDAVANDADWRIRSGLLDNRNSPRELVARVVGTDDTAELAEISALNRDKSPPGELSHLARHPRAEVRLAVARNPRTDRNTLGRLAADDTHEVRRLAACNPRTDPSAVSLLVRAGSTPDLMGLAEPDVDLPAGDLDELARGGPWGRQLATRHPSTAPSTLARLMCDESPRIREWAGAHPAAPPHVIREIRRAGGADDFQGLAAADPDMPVEALRRVAALGPWGAWLVSWHPRAPRDLARNPGSASLGCAQE